MFYTVLSENKVERRDQIKSLVEPTEPVTVWEESEIKECKFSKKQEQAFLEMNEKMKEIERMSW